MRVGADGRSCAPPCRRPGAQVVHAIAPCVRALALGEGSRAGSSTPFAHSEAHCCYIVGIGIDHALRSRRLNRSGSAFSGPPYATASAGWRETARALRNRLVYCFSDFPSSQHRRSRKKFLTVDDYRLGKGRSRANHPSGIDRSDYHIPNAKSASAGLVYCQVVFSGFIMASSLRVRDAEAVA